MFWRRLASPYIPHDRHSTVQWSKLAWGCCGAAHFGKWARRKVLAQGLHFDDTARHDGTTAHSAPLLRILESRRAVPCRAVPCRAVPCRAVMEAMEVVKVMEVMEAMQVMEVMQVMQVVQAGGRGSSAVRGQL